MVHGNRGGGSRAGLVVLGLLALGVADACGSRSPLVEDFGEGFAGEHETGGSGGAGGSLGGTLGGGVGGDGYYGGVGGDYAGGVGGNGYGGIGGDYYPGTGGAPYAGQGGSYPMSVGGAYPSGGYGGKGMGTGGKGMGAGGKGMGAGGTGGGGDIRVYKGCVVACQKYEQVCPGLAADCLDGCLATGSLYPECSGPFADYLFCLNSNVDPDAMCSEDTCSGPGCFTEAQLLCESLVEDFVECLGPGSGACGSSADFSSTTCHLQTFCDEVTYDTSCVAIAGQAGAFACTCSHDDEAAFTVLEDTTVDEVCHEMSRACGFP